MSLLSDLFVRITADTQGYHGPIAKAKQETEALGTAAAGLSARLTAGVSVPLAGVGIAALKMAGQMEQASTAFTTMLKSSVAAQQHLEDLKKFALQTPFEFPDLVTASKRLQALGFDAKDVIPTLTAVGNAAAGLGSGAVGIERITLALGQMKAKGTIQAEEMRQLAEAGIPGWQLLAKILNTDVQTAMKMVEKRAVDSATVLPQLLQGINSRFNGLMAEQAKGILGIFSNLKDAISFTLADIGKAMIPFAKDFATNVAQPMLDKAKELAKAFSELNPATQKFTLGVAALLTIGPPVVSALGFMAQGIGQFGTVLGRVIPMLTSPAGIAVAIGTTLVAAIGYGIASISKLNDSLDSTEKKMAAFKEGTGWMGIDPAAAREIQDALEKNDLALKRGTITLSEYNAELEKLYQKFREAPAATKNLWDGIEMTKDLAKTIGPAIKVIGTETTKATGETKKAVDLLAQAMQRLGVDGENVHRLAKVLEPAYARVREAFMAGKVGALELWESLGKLSEAQFRSQNESLLLTTAIARAAVESSKYQQTLDEAHASMVAYAQAQSVITASLQDQLPNWTALEAAMQIQIEQQRSTAQGSREVAVGLSMIEFALKGVNKNTDEFEKLGIKTTATLDAQYEALTALLEKTKELNAQGVRTYNDVLRVELKTLEVKREAIGLTEEEIRRLAQLERAVGDHSRAVKNSQTVWKQMGQQISTVFTDFSRGIAKAIVEWKGFGDVGKRVITEIAEAMIRVLVENAIEKRVIPALTKILDHAGIVGKGLQKIFGLPAAAPTSIKTPPFIPGGEEAGVGNLGGSGAAGAAASGAMGVAGLVTGIASAVSGIIGNFQMMGMNKSLDIIVKHTLQTANQLIYGLQPQINTYLPFLKNTHEYLYAVQAPLLTGISSSMDFVVDSLGWMRRNWIAAAAATSKAVQSAVSSFTAVLGPPVPQQPPDFSDAADSIGETIRAEGQSFTAAVTRRMAEAVRAISAIPGPVVNVPEQPAPVVNVPPQQPPDFSGLAAAISQATTKEEAAPTAPAPSEPGTRSLEPNKHGIFEGIASAAKAAFVAVATGGIAAVKTDSQKIADAFKGGLIGAGNLGAIIRAIKEAHSQAKPQPIAAESLMIDIRAALSDFAGQVAAPQQPPNIQQQNVTQYNTFHISNPDPRATAKEVGLYLKRLNPAFNV